jgi:hypothetical protein
MTIISIKEFFFQKHTNTSASEYLNFLYIASASIIGNKRMAGRKLLTGLNDWILILAGRKNAERA